MVAYIIISVVVFLVVVVSFNFHSIMGLFKGKKNKEPDAPKESAKNYTLNYDEPPIVEEKDVKIDNLNHEPVAYTEEAFVKATPDELSELENSKKQGGGRLKGIIKSVDNIKVEVENVKGNYETEEDLDDFIMSKKSQASVIADQIKDLSPEMKALIISDVLKRKDEDNV